MNIVNAGPGNLVRVLADRGVKLTVADIDKGERPRITDFDIAIFGGAPYDPNAQDESTLWQIEQIKQGLGEELPILGVCRGFQLLALAADGSVKRAPVPELGMWDKDGKPFTVDLTEEGKRDPLFRGFGDSYRAFQMHQLTVDLSGIPQSYGAVLLGTGEHCRNQVARIGSGVGFQSHIEFTKRGMKRLSKLSDFQKLGPNLVSDFTRFYPDYSGTTRLLVGNFLDEALKSM